MAALFSQPTDVQLLEEYLRRRVDTGESPSPLFHTADVYLRHPEELTTEYAPVTLRDGETRWYFFSTLRDKSGQDQRTRRMVPSCGSWHGDHGEKAVLAGVGGAQIGYKKTFTFSRKEKGKLQRLGWIMSELGFIDGGGGGQGRGRVVICWLYRSPRVTPAPAPEIAEESRGLASDAPPRASTRGSPTSAEESRRAKELAVAASPRTVEGQRGASESAVAGGARTAEGQRGASDSAVAGGARTAEGPRDGSEPEVAGCARTEEGPRDGSEPAVAGGARTRERPRGGSETEVAGSAASAACSCGQDRRSLDHSAARATKAPRKQWVLAQIQLDGEEDDDAVLHKICRIKRVGAPEWSSSSRKRKEREVSSGWLVLGPALAAAVRNASSSSCDICSCARCGERLSP